MSPTATLATMGDPATGHSRAAAAANAGDGGAAQGAGTAQDVRLAVVMTGGASLAVWMGGVATEINLATGGPGGGEAGAVDPVDAALAARYARLKAILDVTLDVDVLAGASAGGINAAMLGFARAHGARLAPLRELWLSLGSLDTLMRTPRDREFPSLLRGDEVVLPALRTGLRAVAATGRRPGPARAENAATALFITTTIMRGELAEHTDSLGGTVFDVDYRGLFVFGTPDLVDPGAVPRLALAARASSAFPGAFEPVYVPVGRAVPGAHPDRGRHPNGAELGGGELGEGELGEGDPDEDRPDMGRYVNSARGFHASDGGILVNRPIGPALAAIFDRPAHRQVRRVLTYVVPSPRPTDVAPDGTRTIPAWDSPHATPPVSVTLLGALGAALNQSIGADLTALRAHNDAVRGTRATRRRLLRLAPAGAPRLADDDLYGAYRRNVADRIATPVVEALLRLLADQADLPRPPDADLVRTDTAARIALTNAALAAVFTTLPDRLPGPDTLGELGRLGQPALDGVKGILLSMINEGYVLCPSRPERVRLAELATAIHTATSSTTAASSTARPTTATSSTRMSPDAVSPPSLPSTPTSDAGGPARLYTSSPRPGVFTTVRAALATMPGATAGEVAAEATRRWLSIDPTGAGGALRPSAAWLALAEVIEAVRAELADLVPRWTPADEPPTGIEIRPAGLTVGQRRAMAARTLADFVAYLPTTRPDAVIALLDLHLVEQETSGAVLDQPVELVQISADLPTELDPDRRWAEDKLTGLRLGNFAAFAKSSWRANDWMWGRLDGAGWLVRILLDPRRLILLRDLALHTPPPGPAADGGLPSPRVPADGDTPVGTGPVGTERPAVDATTWLSGLIDALAEVAGTAASEAVRAELAVLADLTAPVPSGLAATALWVAGGFQRDIATRELVGLAEAIRDDVRGGVDPRPTADFLATVDAALAAAHTDVGSPGSTPDAAVLPDAAVGDVLQACAVSDERITDAAQGPILVGDLAQIVAVVTSWLAAARFLPRPMWPVAFLIRTAARVGYELVRDITRRRRRLVIALGLLLVVLGVVGALVGSAAVGAVGVAAALLGLVVIGVPGWRRLPGGLAVVAAGALVVVAAAGVIPVLHDRLFDWLRDDAVPYLADHPWAWALVFLALVAPGGWSLGEALVARRARRGARQTDGAGRVRKRPTS
ncbi:patatin-like protein [Frankia sp. R82]|uniref:patatin-like protein n=1 Tax=Frankia sp. R82 TaxID=2950553 RepID=UPI002043671E|nr:patatin-like protein [Frankia sp. R82]MCM3883016.1 patatin-like protein [Frankia sp. R82]